MSCEDCEFPKRISWTDGYGKSWSQVVWTYDMANEIIETLIARFGENCKYSVD